jgi:chorismate mutase
MGVAKKIASLKKGQGSGACDEICEQEILSRVSEMAGADYADGTQALYKQIFTLSHSYLQNA